mgnify:CR=1 FL=1|tara:strand:- start:749 stop:1501 length:753 start_codon:yes stop_codon:yes gene_type:complete
MMALALSGTHGLYAMQPTRSVVVHQVATTSRAAATVPGLCTITATATVPRSFGARMSVRPEDMKRADEPLQEEIRGLQVLSGAVGFVVGPPLVGSSVLGIFCGILLGNFLIFQEGRSGAAARELGWSVARALEYITQRALQLWESACAAARERGVPDMLRSAREAATGFSTQLIEELRELDNSSNVSARAIDQMGRQRARVQVWADAKGVTPLVVRVWNGSGLATVAPKLREALAAFEARVEERLRGGSS